MSHRTLGEMLPYLDTEKLSHQCSQILDRHFWRLRQEFACPHAKVVVSQAGGGQVGIHFPDSGTFLISTVSPGAIATLLLQRYENVPNLRLLMWTALPIGFFFALLQEFQRSGASVIRQHERHAILQFPRNNQGEATDAPFAVAA